MKLEQMKRKIVECLEAILWGEAGKGGSLASSCKREIEKGMINHQWGEGRRCIWVKLVLAQGHKLI